MWGVYILHSLTTGHLYTGVTNDIGRRLHEHNSCCKGAKRTKAGRPWILAYWEPCESKSDALKREYQIKQMSRRQKLVLIHRHNEVEPSPLGT
jgi:putative endonuclease